MFGRINARRSNFIYYTFRYNAGVKECIVHSQRFFDMTFKRYFRVVDIQIIPRCIIMTMSIVDEIGYRKTMAVSEPEVLMLVK